MTRSVRSRDHEGVFVETFNNDHRKIGESRLSNCWGEPIVEHTDRSGTAIARSSLASCFGLESVETTDLSGNLIARTEEASVFSADDLEHSDKHFNRTGGSRERSGLFGGDYTESAGAAWMGAAAWILFREAAKASSEDREDAALTEQADSETGVQSEDDSETLEWEAEDDDEAERIAAVVARRQAREQETRARLEREARERQVREEARQEAFKIEEYVRSGELTRAEAAIRSLGALGRDEERALAFLDLLDPLLLRNRGDLAEILLDKCLSEKRFLRAVLEDATAARRGVAAAVRVSSMLGAAAAGDRKVVLADLRTAEATPSLAIPAPILELARTALSTRYSEWRDDIEKEFAANVPENKNDGSGMGLGCAALISTAVALFVGVGLLVDGARNTPQFLRMPLLGRIKSFIGSVVGNTLVKGVPWDGSPLPLFRSLFRSEEWAVIGAGLVACVLGWAAWRRARDSRARIVRIEVRRLLAEELRSSWQGVVPSSVGEDQRGPAPGQSRDSRSGRTVLIARRMGRRVRLVLLVTLLGMCLLLLARTSPWGESLARLKGAGAASPSGEKAPVSRKDLHFLGWYANHRANAGTALGSYAVGIWVDRKDGLVGVLEYPLQAADSLSGALEEVKYDASSGRIEFRARTWAGEGLSGAQVHVRHHFHGVLRGDVLEGAIARSEEDGDTVPVEERLLLERAAGSESSMDYRDREEWERSYLMPVLGFRGPKNAGTRDPGTK